MFRIPQNTAYTRMFYLGQTSLTPAFQLSKAGGTFTDPAGGAAPAIEVGGGWYKFPLGTADTDTLGELAYTFGAGLMNAEFHDLVISGGGDPLDSMVPGGYAVGSAGYTLGHYLDALVSSRLPTTSYTAPNNSGIVGNGNALSILQAGLSGGTYTIQLTTAQFDALIAAVWQTANQIDGQYTYQEALRVILAALAGKLSIVGNVVRIRDTADTKDREAVTTDAIGQRTAVTLNVS